MAYDIVIKDTKAFSVITWKKKNDISKVYDEDRETDKVGNLVII